MSYENKRIGLLRATVPTQDAMVLLAEECGELAQAAIKYYRLESTSIPTPLKKEEVKAQLKEELTDILVTATVAGVKCDSNLFDQKIDRWIERIEAKRKENQMEKIFVSVPMKDRGPIDIFNDISKTTRAYIDENNIDPDNNMIGFIDNMTLPEDVQQQAKVSKRPALIYLSYAIKQMAECDDVIFAGDWENARGCKVERMVYELYFRDEEDKD